MARGRDRGSCRRGAADHRPGPFPRQGRTADGRRAHGPAGAAGADAARRGRAHAGRSARPGRGAGGPGGVSFAGGGRALGSGRAADVSTAHRGAGGGRLVPRRTSGARLREPGQTGRARRRAGVLRTVPGRPVRLARGHLPTRDAGRRAAARGRARAHRGGHTATGNRRHGRSAVRTRRRGHHAARNRPRSRSAVRARRRGRSGAAACRTRHGRRRPPPPRPRCPTSS